MVGYMTLASYMNSQKEARRDHVLYHRWVYTLASELKCLSNHRGSEHLQFSTKILGWTFDSELHVHSSSSV